MKEEKNKKEDGFDKSEEVIDNTSAQGAPEDFTLDESDEGGNITPAIKKLRQKLVECQKEKQEYLLGWQRSKADFVNAKKSLQSDMASLTNFAESGLISELLPVLDSFYAARKNKTAWESVNKEWRVGVEYIEQQLIHTLKSRGLEIINPLGKGFNHDEQEAVEETDGGKSGHVIDVLQLGYKLKGKLLRAARVKVAK